MESIKKYSVQIDYELQGSAVLVKVDKDNCYLITAKHNFKSGKDESYSDVKTSVLNLDKVKITDPNGNEICEVERIVYEEKKLDLLIFTIKQGSEYIRNLPIVEIIKDRHTIYKKHFFYGFPNGEETPSGKLTALAFKVKEDEKHILTLRGDNKNIYEEDEKGFSGSGVFVEDGNSEDEYTHYLTGIVIQVHTGQSFFETISLSEIIDDINHKIYPKINIKEDVFDVDFSKNIYSRILKRRKSTYLVQRFLEYFGKDEDKLDNLKNDVGKRQKIIKFLDNDEEELLKREKELADLYLLKAITYHVDENIRQANFYLNRAKKINNEFKKYKLDNLEELNIDNSEINDSFTILKRAKILYIDAEYEKAIDFFKQALDEVNNEHDKLDIHQYLANSYKKINRDEQAIESYGNALMIYLEKDLEQNLEQSEIYYELALLTKEKEALDYIDTGLKVLEYDIKNEYLELKHKFEIYKKKLLNLESDKVLNPTLIELFKKNPEKYMDEFLENLHNSNGEISNHDIYKKIEEMHLDVKGINAKNQ